MLTVVNLLVLVRQACTDEEDFSSYLDSGQAHM